MGGVLLLCAIYYLGGSALHTSDVFCVVGFGVMSAGKHCARVIPGRAP